MSGLTLEPLWHDFIRIVKKEVKPALGCTEPVSLALAAAVAASELKGKVEHIEAWVSPNLMKNAMAVTVPGTGMTGLPVAVALGALTGDHQAGLEVLKGLTTTALSEAKSMITAGKVKLRMERGCNEVIYSCVRVYCGDSWASATIAGEHTNVVRIETNDGVIFDKQADLVRDDENTSLSVLSKVTLSDIFRFINNVPLDAIRFILDAAKLNGELSREGLRNSWGLHIGKTLKKQCENGLLANDISTEIIVRTSAASDARMGGAALPAMSNSGSGNQGITATIPVIVIAEHVKADEERLARALMLSHLGAIYIHNQLPRLSALCAATTAAMGAAAGMAWLIDDRYEILTMTINSMIGDISGIICDGASNSCAMKVSTSVSAAWKAVLMALDNSSVSGTDGIVSFDIEKSIANLCSLACHAMQITDKQIIEIMEDKM